MEETLHFEMKDKEGRIWGGRWFCMCTFICFFFFAFSFSSSLHYSPWWTL